MFPSAESAPFASHNVTTMWSFVWSGRGAADEPGVRAVRATISPDNAASLATIAGVGFTPNGEQWDEEDGLELIFDRPA